MTAPNAQKTVIFLHMPKAGGSTLHHVLDWNYDHPRSITVYKQIPPFLALPDAEKRRIDCLKGTVFYGIHRYLPQECVYITILRDPIDRVISHYFYLFARKKRLGEEIKAIDLEEVLRLEPFHATHQLRLLIERDSMDSALRDPLPDNAVEIAAHTLETRFAVYGTLERYDETLLMMKQAFGWSRAYYARQNVNENRLPVGDIAPRHLDILREMCAPEIELYRYVKQQTEARIAAQGESFRAELARLRQVNARFERLWNLARPIHGTPLWRAMRSAARAVTRR
jgi:hypothetical protein